MDPHIAWLAGFYEGEGTVSASIRIRGEIGRTENQRTIVFTISQKNPEPLFKARDIIVGLIGIPNDKVRMYQSASGKNVGLHRLSITNFDHVDRIMTAMWPWLSMKRKEQAVDALLRYADASISRTHNAYVECDSELTYTQLKDSFPEFSIKEG